MCVYVCMYGVTILYICVLFYFDVHSVFVFFGHVFVLLTF